MKLKTTTLAALAALAMAGAASAAATVSYSYYTATSSTDTSWVSVSGYDSVVAANAGPSTTTTVSYGGVSWAAGNQVTVTNNGVSLEFAAPGYTWVTGGETGLFSGTALLDDSSYVGNGVLADGGDRPYVVHFDGLTVGKEYKAQFVFADNRDNTGLATLVANSGVSGDSTDYIYSHTSGEYAVITASFTADGTVANFQPQIKWGPTGDSNYSVSAVQLLAVPEPSAALLGGLGMLCLLRRRRA